MLCLTILESHGDQEEERQYSLEELRELMNKLMLMSGKVEQSTEVEKFSEVSFELYVSLCISSEEESMIGPRFQ